MKDPDVIRLQYHNDRLRELVDRLEHEKKAIQAKLDAVMWEFCPKDMTPEQIKEWGRNQGVYKAPGGEG
jgi:hypothetical protein